MHTSSAESTVLSQLRKSVANIERQLEALSLQSQTEPSQTSTAELRAAFSRLVQLLALGPEPEVRECPFCKHIVRSAAKLCGYCWKTLQPLTEASKADAAAPLGAGSAAASVTH